MTHPLGSFLKTQHPDATMVSGSFSVVASAIANVRPSGPTHFSVRRFAAGVYVVTLDFNGAESIIDSDAAVGPSAALTGALPTATPVANPMISKDFQTCDANGANFAADTTNTKILILQPNTAGNALADVTANYRLSFYALVSMQPWSK